VLGGYLRQLKSFWYSQKALENSLRKLLTFDPYVWYGISLNKCDEHHTIFYDKNYVISPITGTVLVLDKSSFTKGSNPL